MECWDNEPDNRPNMRQVVTKLKDIITKTKVTTEIDQIESNLESSNKQQPNLKSIDTCPFPNSSLHGGLSRTIENFHKMNTNEIEPTTVSNQATTISYKIKEKQSKF